MASANHTSRFSSFLNLSVLFFFFFCHFKKLLTFQSTDSCSERVLFPAWDVLASLVWYTLCGMPYRSRDPNTPERQGRRLIGTSLMQICSIMIHLLFMFIYPALWTLGLVQMAIASLVWNGFLSVWSVVDLWRVHQASQQSDVHPDWMNVYRES